MQHYLDCLMLAGHSYVEAESCEGMLLCAPGRYVVLDEPSPYFGGGHCYRYSVALAGGAVVREDCFRDGFVAWRRRIVDFAAGDSLAYRAAWDSGDIHSPDPVDRYAARVRFASPEYVALTRGAAAERRSAAERQRQAERARCAAEQAVAAARCAAEHDAWAATQHSDTVFVRPPRSAAQAARVA